MVGLVVFAIEFVMLAVAVLRPVVVALVEVAALWLVDFAWVVVMLAARFVYLLGFVLLAVAFVLL